jgi:hypothetical protein
MSNIVERQKVVRKIHQIHKRLTKSGLNPALEEALFEARVDLNYIMVRRPQKL